MSNPLLTFGNIVIFSPDTPWDIYHDTTAGHALSPIGALPDQAVCIVRHEPDLYTLSYRSPFPTDRTIGLVLSDHTRSLVCNGKIPYEGRGRNRSLHMLTLVNDRWVWMAEVSIQYNPSAGIKDMFNALSAILRGRDVARRAQLASPLNDAPVRQLQVPWGALLTTICLSGSLTLGESTSWLIELLPNAITTESLMGLVVLLYQKGLDGWEDTLSDPRAQANLKGFQDLITGLLTKEELDVLVTGSATAKGQNAHFSQDALSVLGLDMLRNAVWTRFERVNDLLKTQEGEWGVAEDIPLSVIKRAEGILYGQIVLAIFGLCDGPLPTCHDDTIRANGTIAAAIATVWVNEALTQRAVLLQDTRVALWPHPLERIWNPWGDPRNIHRAEVRPLSEQTLRRWRALCADYETRSRRGLELTKDMLVMSVPNRFTRLRSLKVERLWLHLPGIFSPANEEEESYEEDGVYSVWLRLGPNDGSESGFLLHWEPGAEPPVMFTSQLPRPLAWELHLLMSAWYCDMRAEGEERVLERVQRVQARPTEQQRKGRTAPPALIVPRVRYRYLSPVEGTRPKPAREVNYGSAEDRETIEERIASRRTIRVHIWRRHDEVTYHNLDRKLHAWELLDASTKMLINRYEQTDDPLAFPDNATVRGLDYITHADGKEEPVIEYERSVRGAARRAQARQVYARSLLGAEMALALEED